MRWLLLSVLAVVLGAVGGFAIYTFGWRDRGSGDERERALAHAHELAGLCFQTAKACHAADVHRVANGIWRVRIVTNGQPGRDRCFDIQLARFSIDLAPVRVDGVARVDCSA
jgi:hypothetical protein